MMKKVAAAMGIFVLLFSGAWVLNQKSHQASDSSYVENQPGIMNVTHTNQLENRLVEPFIKFYPREYVRIED
ncbi:hypothetical protein [Bacillus tuaregi]|uniref:hypothetical protein n=1 Tax=Bacillus tuaregi TaxID=1816695 RepID=UPI0008F7E88E|nr:hypothetical protein [Bacillus tuaregi]